MKIVHFFSESHLKFPSTTPPLFSASPFQLNPTWKLGSRLFKKHPCNFLLVLVYIFAHLRVTSYAVCLHWQVVLFNYSFLHNCTASCYWVHHRAGKGRLKIADGAHSDGDPPTASSLFTRWVGEAFAQYGDLTRMKFCNIYWCWCSSPEHWKLNGNSMTAIWKLPVVQEQRLTKR